MPSRSNGPVRHRPISILLAASVAIVAGTSATAQTMVKGPHTLSDPWARETAKGQSAGGGFLLIANRGKAEDRLTGGSTQIAAEVQVHTMSMDGGIMRMRRLKDGLALPAGATVALKPGSFHIMFVGLRRPLKRGETIPVTLHFARAGKVLVPFRVEAVTFGGQTHDGH